MKRARLVSPVVRALADFGAAERTEIWGVGLDAIEAVMPDAWR